MNESVAPPGPTGVAPAASGKPALAVHKQKRTVATRVLLSYAVVTLAFSMVVGWAAVALNNAAGEAVLMRSGYLPLSIALRDALGSQDVWNTQLNHVTSAKNPADQRAWFDIALRAGRPQTFEALRATFSKAFVSENGAPRGVGAEFVHEATDIERFLDADRELVPRLFEALNERNEERAEQLREQLVTRGSQAKKRLNQLEQRVQRLVDSLIADARVRERWALGFLVALAAFTAIVGALMALYARRVLAPLAAVTERARAVASGDLTPRPVFASPDEIGDLAQTFEAMVSAIAKASADLLAAERLATIGKMAAHVTHEIRNPLSSLALNVELLEEELGDGAEAKALLRAVKNEVDRLTALSERYLSVAGGRAPPRVEREDIGQLCRDALDFVRGDVARHGIRLSLDVDDDLPPVSVDEGQIRQALYNLIRNARESMSEGGRVQVAARRADGGVDITVDDEGSGIDEERRARLFEPFFTTKSHGTGLGLVITREIVEAHGGKIRCEPRTPRGTRFVLHLPAVAGEETAVAEPESATS
jgi:signal transduction histidine kinase